ncbi:MAG TPA: FUSC family protein [Nocardioidaceae bacterium]|nr:FUSC family protein [Nocardioidaceae bacterium]
MSTRASSQVGARTNAAARSSMRTGRASARARLSRLRARSWHVGQASIAAAVAFLLARELLDHPRPFLAPVAAIVCLGMSYGQRLRRVAEVTIGVAVGVGVADLFVQWVGTGVWQVVVIVAASMSIALLLDAGPLLVTQAAVQSVIVATLLPDPEAGVDRWLDALVGGSVALVAAAVVPRAPLRRPREEAARLADNLAVLLHETADRAEDGDVDRAEDALRRARATESVMDDLRLAAREGLSVVASSPLRRGHRQSVRQMAALVEPLDHAIRNTRVLVRRVVAAARYEEPVPVAYVNLVDHLADAVEQIAAELAEGRLAVHAQDQLVRVGERTVELASPPSLSAAVILAQMRSLVVDLLQITGLDADQAMDKVPRRVDYR